MLPAGRHRGKRASTGSSGSGVRPPAGLRQSLVYVAAFAPSEGQSIVDMTKDYPRSSGLYHLITDKEGCVTMSLEGISKHFAQDLPASEAALIAVTQGPIRGSNFEEKGGRDGMEDSAILVCR